MTAPTLAEISRRVGPKKKYLRAFVVRYEQLFTPARNKPITVLEIGVGGYKDPHKGGGSLRMWGEFFPNAVIVGLDHFPKKLDLPGNVKLHCGSQTDIKLLDSLVSEYGGFDIVIDDASHITDKTIASFQVLRKHTRQFYIVEDLHMLKAKGTRDYFEQIDGADFNTIAMCVVTCKRQ